MAWVTRLLEQDSASRHQPPVGRPHRGSLCPPSPPPLPLPLLLPLTVKVVLQALLLLLLPLPLLVWLRLRLWRLARPDKHAAGGRPCQQHAECPLHLPGRRHAADVGDATGDSAAEMPWVTLASCHRSSTGPGPEPTPGPCAARPWVLAAAGAGSVPGRSPLRSPGLVETAPSRPGRSLSPLPLPLPLVRRPRPD